MPPTPHPGPIDILGSIEIVVLPDGNIKWQLKSVAPLTTILGALEQAKLEIREKAKQQMSKPVQEAPSGMVDLLSGRKG